MVIEVKFLIKNTESYNRIKKAFKGLYRKPDNVTDDQWVKQMVIRYVKNTVKRYEMRNMKTPSTEDIIK
ncbi:MAG: hypothetical protein ACTSUF_03605 [Candidatus Heimdallarchaeaceae archaeon]